MGVYSETQGGFVYGTPFTGIDAVGAALKERPHLRAVQTNLLEFMPCYADLYKARGFNDWKPVDVMDFPASSLDDCHVLCASPPCQPFSSQGHQHGSDDVRTLPFWKVIEFAVELHRRRTLLAIILENSPGCFHKKNGSVFFDDFQAAFLEALPDWTPFVPWFMDAKDYEVPVSRNRMIAVSSPRLVRDVLKNPIDVTEEIAYICPFAKPVPTGRRLLSECLDLDIQRKMPRSQKQLSNYRAWKEVFRKEFADGRGPNSCAVVDVSRHPDKGFRANLTWDRLPSPTTGNCNMIVLSQSGDGLLTVAERARCMGFDYTKLKPYLSDRQIMKGVGNAIAVPVIGAVIDSVSEALSRFFTIVKASLPRAPRDPEKLYKKRRLNPVVISGIHETPMLSLDPSPLEQYRSSLELLRN